MNSLVLYKLLRNNSIVKGSDLFFVFPNNEGLISYYGLLYADYFMNEINSKKIFIVTKDNIIKESADELINSNHEVIDLSDSQMNKFLKFTALHSNLMGESIFKNLYYISTLYPYGEGFKALLIGNFFNEEYLVWNRILHNKDFYYSKPLKKLDENEKIKSLFLA